MGYVALYREWRPQRFADVVGQEHVSRTLRQAIQQGRIAHAYLFTGPRGTGKTSVAKILAKAVNCASVQEGEPCNQCASCQEITAGSHVDVLEIDAASNRGIDEIRDLRERVRYSPASARYKVYIIDEVHMLTTEAFNALLKTLEEPPGHALFVLATTEPHKVPATIVSRCQVFEFRRLTESQIRRRLKEVAEATGAKVEEGVLELLAREAEGGLRDALSLFDQSLAFGGKELTLADVNQMLGKASDVILEEMLGTLARGDLPQTLRLLQKLAVEGKDVRVFTRDLLTRAREMLLEELEAAARAPHHGLFGTAELLSLLETLAAAENEMKWSNRPRLILEMSLLRWGLGRKPAADGAQMAEKGQEEKSSLERTMATGKAQEGKAQGIKAREAKPQEAKVTAMPPEARPLSAAAPKTNGGKKEERPADELGETPGLSLASLQERWPASLERIKKVRPSLYALLKQGQLYDLEGNKVGFLFKFAAHRDILLRPENRELVEKVLQEMTGVALRVTGLTQEDVSQPPLPDPKEDPLVKEALKIFGGEIVEEGEL